VQVYAIIYTWREFDALDRDKLKPVNSIIIMDACMHADMQ
jgi:hypothetical protein